jgi:hypothetical protein|nr:hypothetical protein [Oxalobacteraceae bacterium]
MAAPKTQAQKGTQKRRMLEGQVVRPVLYNGRNIGHGKYFAAEVNGQLVMDDQGRPMQFRQVGELQ